MFDLNVVQLKLPIVKCLTMVKCDYFYGYICVDKWMHVFEIFCLFFIFFFGF